MLRISQCYSAFNTRYPLCAVDEGVENARHPQTGRVQEDIDKKSVRLLQGKKLLQRQRFLFAE